MKKRKMWISMALAAVMLTVTACGGESSPAGAESSAAEPADSAAAGTAGSSSSESGQAQSGETDIRPAIDSSVDYTQGETYSLIIATDGAEDRVDGMLVHYMADQLNEITGGRIQLQMYFNGSMGTDIEIIESVQSGHIAFCLGGTAPTANFVAELSVIDLPFLYKNTHQFRSTMDDPAVTDFYKQKYAENGFQLLGFFDTGMREMTSNKKVESLDDIKGQKIRVMENNLHIAIWNALGANPSPMAFSEVYIALQQGTIDAQENPFEVIYTNRLYEQQEYVIMTNHLPAAHNLLISKVVFDGMSETDQALIEAVGTAAIQYSREQCDARLDQLTAEVKASGTEIVELSDEVLSEMKDRCASVYDEARATYGDEQVDMQIEAANQYADVK